MAILQQITLTFTKPIQVSVQKGDISYYTDDPMGENIVRMGKILSVDLPSKKIVTEILSITPRPTSTSFILFTKDNKANTSGILGYYAEVEMRNDSRKKAELFSVGSEIFESSK
tara:strand:- start:1611 stop:1952 length:342 start_codon:yes stop_codon:yes gene_type:complete